jgi:hypothetical protein
LERQEVINMRQFYTLSCGELSQNLTRW